MTFGCFLQFHLHQIFFESMIRSLKICIGAVMTLAAQLHQFIDKCNVLHEPTKAIEEYLIEHPDLYKAALLVNHIFRAMSMAAFSVCLPFSAPVTAAICFIGSLFYRLTVETHCAYKFALPAFAGMIAFQIAQAGLAELISGVAVASLSAFAVASVSFLPLVAYFVYIVLTVSYDVDLKVAN